MTKRCELYLRLHANALSGSALPDLEALLSEIRPAALLVIGANADLSLDRLRQACESNGRQTVAILIENDAGLAKTLNADGVHLHGDSAQLTEARHLLGEDRAIGVSCPLSRHESMVMAEAGADYVAFGDPALTGQRNVDSLVDMTRWWSELLEIPCVAWLADGDTKEDANKLVCAGADFLCIGIEQNHFAERLGFVRDLAALMNDIVNTA